jgi:hypothetical protein
LLSDYVILAAKRAPESKRGAQNQSIDPFLPTSAAVWVSPISAQSSIRSAMVRVPWALHDACPRPAICMLRARGQVEAGSHHNSPAHSTGENNMNTYAREVRGMLENLGLVRRSHSPWSAGFWAGAGFGVVAGAALAGLLTPNNGKEMRKIVGSKAKHLASSAEKKISAIKNTRVNGAREQLHA